MEAVLELPRQGRPRGGAARARRYACFEHFGEDTPGLRLRGRASASTRVVRGRGRRAAASSCSARAARVSRGRAGRRPRTSPSTPSRTRAWSRTPRSTTGRCSAARVSSWNLRDRHMAETLDALVGHLERQRGRPARIVVWAHNSHLGDARATEMGERGELNLGQLVRERHGEDAVLRRLHHLPGHRHRRVATGTRRPSASGSARRSPGSYEALFHERRQRALPAGPARQRPCSARRSRRRAWSARSASSTGRRPSGTATTSTLACRASSTR